MCRSIQVLRGQEPATNDEVQAAALQFVRKVSGMRHPAERNRAPFDAAVAEVAASVERLLAALPPSRATPRPAAQRRMRPSGEGA